MTYTYRKSLVLETNTNKFLIAVGVLLVACQLEREDINVEIHSEVKLPELPIYS